MEEKGSVPPPGWAYHQVDAPFPYNDMPSKRTRKLRPSLEKVFALLVAFVTVTFLFTGSTPFSYFQHHRLPSSKSPSSPSANLDEATTFTSSPYAISQFDAALAKCRTASAVSGAPPRFAARDQSDRFDGEHVAPRTRIVNATVWTGRSDGKEVLKGAEILLEKGIVKEVVAHGQKRNINAQQGEKVVDAMGRWVTPGIIDIHVHMGVDSIPNLPSVEDTNTRQTPVAPFLRSIDGLNQHDLSFKRTIAGGVTSGLVLPGSGGLIGGQAFPIKLRSTKDNYPSQRIIDPPSTLVLPNEGNSDLSLLSTSEREAYESYLTSTGMSRSDNSSTTPWRHMKMACGENARRLYGLNRMDEAWNFRRMFEQARKIKDKQDAFCESALGFEEASSSAVSAQKKGGRKAPKNEEERTFPEELEFEALVAVLRGQVKVNTHCYTSTDFDSYVRHSNEFKFPVAAFHHAHEAYLVPELIKQTYGEPKPAVAIFSTNGHYKMEAYFGSPHAGAILKAHNITPIYKSDHPVTDSRRVLNQAAQGHHFGLDEVSAMQSVTTAGAIALGLDHRIGYINEGHDADVVIWNTHPLRLGATPVQVWIDGISQLEHAHTPSGKLPPVASALKATAHDHDPAPPAPASAKYEHDIKRVRDETAKIMRFESLAFRTPVRSVREVAFRNVSKVFTRDGKKKNGVRLHSLESPASSKQNGELATVRMRDGELTICDNDDKLRAQLDDEDASVFYGACANNRADEEIDLQGGVILPGISSLGSNLGLTDIVSEQEASDGGVLDPFSEKGFVASNYRAALQDWPIAKAVDGLQWGGHDLTRSHAHGVVSSIVPPQGQGFLRGISTQFNTGVTTRLEPDAIRHEEVAMHVALTHYSGPPSISEQITLLKNLLQDGEHGRGDEAWARVVKGQLPLVVQAAKASHIASLVSIKQRFPHIRLIISNASEAVLADMPEQLAEHDIAVILSPRTWGITWDERRALPGPPLTKGTTLSTLLRAGVKVAFRIEEGWQAANLLFDVTWAAKETDGLLDEEDIVSMLTNSLDDIFNLDRGWRNGRKHKTDYVAYDADPFEYGAAVVAIGSKDKVELFT